MTPPPPTWAPLPAKVTSCVILVTWPQLPHLWNGTSFWTEAIWWYNYLFCRLLTLMFDFIWGCLFSIQALGRKCLCLTEQQHIVHYTLLLCSQSGPQTGPGQAFLGHSQKEKLGLWSFMFSIKVLDQLAWWHMPLIPARIGGRKTRSSRLSSCTKQVWDQSKLHETPSQKQTN